MGGTVPQTRTKLTGIDTLGGTFNAPSSLWDTANDKIQPEHQEANYAVRLSLDVNSGTNNRNDITLELDIGGGIGTIFTDARTTPDTNPRILTFDFHIYCLATFVANGGEIYLTAGRASYTIASASLVIFRI